CAPTDRPFRASPPEQALIRDANAMTYVAGGVVVGNGVPCSLGSCATRCLSFSFISDPGTAFLRGLSSDALAMDVVYSGGTVLGGLREIVWFVGAQPAPDDYTGQLRRVVFDGTTTCVSRATCGGPSSVADGVEALAYRVWEFVPDRGGGWQMVPLGRGAE